MCPSLVPVAVIAATILIPMATSAAPVWPAPNQDPVNTKNLHVEALLHKFGKPVKVIMMDNGDALWVYQRTSGKIGLLTPLEISPDGAIISVPRSFTFVIPSRPQQPLPADKYHPGAKLLPFRPQREALANGQ